MCGRYTFTKKPDPSLIIQVPGQKLEFEPRYNIAPSQMSLISPQHDPQHLYFYKWGLIPRWAKDPKIGYKMINARAETLWEKPSFKESAKSQRCLVWADGFYEWKKEGSGKQAYWIGLKGKGLFSMAGISSIWVDATGEEIRSFSIITTEPNQLMENIHDRMPVILPKAQREKWLDTEQAQSKLQEMLIPLDANAMQAYPVSPSVGNVKNDHKGLIEPYTPPPTLFG